MEPTGEGPAFDEEIHLEGRQQYVVQGANDQLVLTDGKDAHVSRASPLPSAAGSSCRNVDYTPTTARASSRGRQARRRSCDGIIRDCQIAQNDHNGAQDRDMSECSRQTSASRTAGLRRGAMSLLCVAAVGARVADGSPAPAAVQGGVDLVQFSVILTDKQGAPITGLKPGGLRGARRGQAADHHLFLAKGIPRTATTSATRCRCTWA